MESLFLYNETAKKLYNEVKNLPIIDYHCHLSVDEIIEDKQLENISKTWLACDHYKWRLMRSQGVEERYITGDASDYEKFEKYMQTLCYAIGSPLYHWSKLELAKYFDVTDELLPQNIKNIYDKANLAIQNKQLSPQKILQMSNVEKVCIVEDAMAIDYKKYANIKNLGIKTQITPIMRFDKMLLLPEADIIKAMPSIVENYKKINGNSADFGIEYIDENDDVTISKYCYLLDICYKNNFVVQLHFGAMRNNNKAMFESIGADNGFDSISEKPYLTALAKIFKKLKNIGKTVIFGLNPADNAKIATFAVNYADGGIKGKVQMGAAWWFNDHQNGINDFLKIVSSSATLASSVGMLTDSRSIISYVRHDYFRRLLCKYVGEIAEKGEFTTNFDILKTIVCDVAYYNIKDFLG